MQILIVAIAVAPVLWFILQSMLEHARADSATKYLLFGEPLERGQFLTTLLASNSGLSGAVYLIAVYGWLTGAATGLWALLFFALTMIASDRVITRIAKRHPGFLPKRGTLHEFLGLAFQSQQVRLLAGVASLFAYVGLVACEIVLAQEVIEALLGASGIAQSWAIHGRTLLAFLVLAYTFAAGFRAVIKTEAVQIWLMIAMLACGLIIIFSTIGTHPDAMGSHAKIFGDSFLQLLFAPKSMPSVFDHLFFFVFLNVVFWGAWWPVAMDQWHRSAATQSDETPVDKVTGTASVLTFSYFLVLCGVFATLGAFSNCVWGGEITNPLLTVVSGYMNDSIAASGSLSLFNSVVLGLFLAGLLAAIVSTIDTYVVVAAQSLLVDVTWSQKYGRINDITDDESVRLLPWARISVLGVGVMMIAVSFWFASLYDVYEAIYASFCLQFASLGPLLIALVAEKPEDRKRQATVAIVVSIVASIAGMGFIIQAIETAAASGGDPTEEYKWLYAWPEIVMVLSVVMMLRPQDFKKLIRKSGAQK